MKGSHSLPDVVAGVPQEWRLPVSLALIGERMAALEARLAAEVALRESDMASIRSSMHEIRQSLQTSVLAEHKCSIGLATLGEKYDVIAKSIEKISSSIDEISNERYRLLGGWGVVMKIITILGMGGGVVGVVIAGLTYITKR